MSTLNTELSELGCAIAGVIYPRLAQGILDKPTSVQFIRCARISYAHVLADIMNSCGPNDLAQAAIMPRLAELLEAKP